MRIVFVGGIFPAENMKEICSLSRGVIQFAADTLQKSIIQGLGAYTTNVDIINLPFLGSFPKKYKRLFSPSNSFVIQSDYGKKYSLKGHNIAYCNLTFFKSYFVRREATKALRAWANANKDDNLIIIVYSLNKALLNAAISVRNEFPYIKIVSIVPDLPAYMSAGGNSYLRRWYHRNNVRKMRAIYPQIDGYVLLSPFMREAMGIEDKPFAIVEGIYNVCDEPQQISIKSDSKHKTILYAGTLAKRYGILNLAKAFMQVDDKNARLVICGNGDGYAELKAMAETDKRIELTGNVTRTKVLELIHEATLLVNPRTPEGEFTKYSFPSKTMEYLASGTPTLIYKLPAIDDEYYKYCFALSKLGVDALAAKIIEILSMSPAQRNQLGQDSRRFILEQKNPERQVKKIMNLIDEIL